MMYLRILSFTLLHLLAFYVHADISVSPIIVDLTATNPDAEVTVKNVDVKHKAYVEVTPYFLSNPDDPTSPKQRVRNPEKEGLVVYPSKLVLLPGQTQFVRILKTQRNLFRDKVYEVDFVPKVSTHVVETPQDKGPVMGIQVIVAYGARVTSRPEIMSPSISVKRVNKQLIITNKGNTHLKILSCNQDISGTKTEVPLPVHTLFAGKTITHQLNFLSPVTVEVYLMDKKFGVFHTN